MDVTTSRRARPYVHKLAAEYARLTESTPQRPDEGAHERAARRALQNDQARAAQPAAPETVACFECGGTGTVEGIDADPLPSGEPGEPYQVQEQCKACGGSGAQPAAPETEPDDPEPIVNETVSGHARRRQLVDEARRRQPAARETERLPITYDPTNAIETARAAIEPGDGA